MHKRRITQLVNQIPQERRKELLDAVKTMEGFCEFVGRGFDVVGCEVLKKKLEGCIDAKTGVG